MASSSTRPLPQDLKLLGQMRDELTKQWKRSRSYAQQVNQMPTILALKELQIDNALLMGLGTISPFTPESWELYADYKTDELLGHGGRERRGVRGMTKLVAFECWLEMLRKKFDIPNNKVHVQEFDFEGIAARFIQALGYTVLDDVSEAQALHYITKTTFVISVGEGSIGELSNMGVMPALMVMSSVSLEVHKPGHKVMQLHHRFMKFLFTMRLICDSDTIQRGGPGSQTSIEERMVWMRNYAWYWKPDSHGAGASQRMGRDNQSELRHQILAGSPMEDSQVVIPNKQTPSKQTPSKQTPSEQTPAPSVYQREASSASTKPRPLIDSYSPAGVAGLMIRASSLKTDKPDRPAREPSQGTRKVSFANTISNKSTATPQQKNIKNWKALFVVDSSADHFDSRSTSGLRREKSHDEFDDRANPLMVEVESLPSQPTFNPPAASSRVASQQFVNTPARSSVPSNAQDIQPQELNRRPASYMQVTATRPKNPSKLHPIQPHEINERPASSAQEPSASNISPSMSAAAAAPVGGSGIWAPSMQGFNSAESLLTVTASSESLPPKNPSPPLAVSSFYGPTGVLLPESGDKISPSQSASSRNNSPDRDNTTSPSNIPSQDNIPNRGTTPAPIHEQAPLNNRPLPRPPPRPPRPTPEQVSNINRTPPRPPRPPPSHEDTSSRGTTPAPTPEQVLNNNQPPPRPPRPPPREPQVLRTTSRPIPGPAPRRKVVGPSQFANSNLGVFVLLVVQGLWIWYFMFG